MDILITGGHGQLGRELERQLKHTHSVISLGKNDLDVTNKEKVDKIISQCKPHLIIHAAAFTAVDHCEIDRRKAFEVNGFAAGYVAKAAKNIGARMFYISSDYVFDGKKQSPYNEDDHANPQSIYGMSKWLGEKLVHTFNSYGTVIRTSWVYGHDGKNFVKTILELAKKKEEIKVVNDQIGSPTYVHDLAGVIIQLFDKKNAIYHVRNSGSCTWYEFAKAIFTEAGFNPKLIVPTTTKEYGALASRPQNSILGYDALLKENITPPRLWNLALKDFIRKELSS